MDIFTKWLLTRRFKRGVALLDSSQRAPMWHRMVSTERLDMNSAHECVLGQIFSDYGTGLRWLGIPTGRPYGFLVYSDRESALLGDLWSDEVRRREAEHSVQDSVGTR